MGDILRLIFKDNSNAHAQYYRVHVQEVEISSTDAFRGKPSRTLSWWCFNPGIAMEEFSRLGVGSIILTSGTLSPMDSFAEELKLEFPIRLENPHVISGNQIWAGVAPVGPSGYSFNSSYRSRGSVEYKLELGNAIVNFARIVPDGLLVFFPSYYLLDQCISCWKTMGQQGLSNSTTIWERICKHKLPVVEPRQSTLFLWQLNCNILVLLVSEGLDFADHAGRAVVITGLPFATMTDPKCYSKFGDVVYTLTRFFRDGGHRGPPKLELAQNEDQEVVPLGDESDDCGETKISTHEIYYGTMAKANDHYEIMEENVRILQSSQLSDKFHLKKEHKDVVSQAAHCNNEEMKGSAFLIQVREKLTDTEYREFVGFMKALKSKAMKIGHVLQSIARLFSVPDRLSLLHGYQI
ncbi:UNVERIFIED_CONTAM: Regulator of telomere elongation helicase 1 [Sesamum angustifolium]|uniref:Regulator of telomere elongation helicase 1 n=1 Tax=Sesamum angustifolium TaxID=2727405 RepID=A0AAW2LLA8_9LAMI